jgi:general stress protein 26
MAKMTESEWKAFLVEKPRTGKLGTVRKDGRPHVAPIWFDLDNDGTILFMTGHRLRRGPKVRKHCQL